MAKVIKADGTTIVVEPKNGTDFELHEMYELIGCDIIEFVRVGEKWLVVDEEGIMNRKPLNSEASKMAGMTILGDALLCNINQIK